jgi:hypothetical protein
MTRNSSTIPDQRKKYQEKVSKPDPPTGLALAPYCENTRGAGLALVVLLVLGAFLALVVLMVCGLSAFS